MTDAIYSLKYTSCFGIKHRQSVVEARSPLSLVLTVSKFFFILLVRMSLVQCGDMKFGKEQLLKIRHMGS